MTDDEVPEEWQQQKKLFAELEKNTGCMGGLLVMIWFTLLAILWRVW